MTASLRASPVTCASIGRRNSLALEPPNSFQELQVRLRISWFHVGASLNPSLMPVREIQNKVKEMTLFYPTLLVLWPLRKDEAVQVAPRSGFKLTHILLMSLNSLLYLRESLRTWRGKRRRGHRGW